MFSIRKFVGYSATSLGLGVVFTLALAPQVGVAAEPSSTVLRPHAGGLGRVAGPPFRLSRSTCPG
jgi:hypothetical protein